MLLRPSTGMVRKETPDTTRPPVSFPGGIETPMRPDATTPPMPAQESVSSESRVNVGMQAQPESDVVANTCADLNETQRIYEAFTEQNRELFSGLGEPTLIEGRYFYNSAPLGLEWAGRRMVVPLGINPQTGQYEYDEFFELDRATWVEARSRNVGDQRNIQRGAEVAAATQMPLLDETGAERELNMLSAEDLMNVKVGLVQIGALDADKIGSLNTFDTQSNPQITQAFQRLVGLAQNNMLDWRTMLSRMVRNNETVAPTATTSTGRIAPTIRLTNPNDLKAVADNVATRTIGRALTDEEANAFVTSYQQMERAYQQRAAYGGEVTMAPDVQVAAQEQIREQAPDEYDVYQMGSYLDVFRAATRGQI